MSRFLVIVIGAALAFNVQARGNAEKGKQKADHEGLRGTAFPAGHARPRRVVLEPADELAARPALTAVHSGGVEAREARAHAQHRALPFVEVGEPAAQLGDELRFERRKLDAGEPAL